MNRRLRRMQQHVTIGPLRADGRIVGVVVTVEDVTARVPRTRSPTSQDRRATTRRTVGAGVGVTQIEALTRLMAQNDWRLRRATVTTLAEHGDAIVESLVRTLRDQHHDLPC